MPKQESYLELKHGDDSVSVLKTYDASFAKEAFDSMDESALSLLAQSLRLEETFEEIDIPEPDDAEYRNFLWEAVVDSAIEDGHTRSYFVVTVNTLNKSEKFVFVSPDWPTAEIFANSLVQGATVDA